MHDDEHSTQSLIDDCWDFNDPAASEQRLRAACRLAHGPAGLELRTQIARALGLQRRFDVAHRLLDETDAELKVHADEPAFAAARIRLLLERGRAFNSSKSADKALPLFVQAWESAKPDRLHDVLAVDAAHMIAIVHHNAGDADAALEWNRRALQHVESSSIPRARQWGASLHNNIGWTLHARGDFADALTHFESALAERIEHGKPDDIRVARWCVGKCLRSLGRIAEALRLQQQMLVEVERAGAAADGYLHEEVAECLHALDRTAEARPHFFAAHQILSQDQWLAEQEPQRLERLGRLAHK